MRRMTRSLVLLLALLAALPASAQQVVNGGFESGGQGWTNHPVTSGSSWNTTDLDGDGDREAVLSAASLTNASQGLLLVQDMMTDQVDLQYGIALAADVGATNLEGDIRAFVKLEIGNAVSGAFGTTNIPGLSLTSEGDPDAFATTNAFLPQVTLVKTYKALSNELAAAGATIADVKWIRAVLFLLRFDAAQNPSPGSGYFDRVSWGLVSRAYDAPGIPNGGFEYDRWTWGDNPITSGSGYNIRDRDGDGDKELELDAAGLTDQYASRLFVWEADARMIDFTQGLTLTADLGATNLAPGVKAFTKLEFSTNGPPNRNGSVLPTVNISGEYDPANFATNNESRPGVSLGMTHENLTNLLASSGTGARVEDLTFVRVVMFLLQTGPNGSPAYGYGWFDNARLDFTYRDRPNLTTGRIDGNQLVVGWSSLTGRTYRVQRLTDLNAWDWTNVADGVAGQPGTTQVTNALESSSPAFLRVVRRD